MIIFILQRFLWTVVAGFSIKHAFYTDFKSNWQYRQWHMEKTIMERFRFEVLILNYF